MELLDIYEPAEDSYLLAKWVRKRAFGKVLDIGMGSGIQTMAAFESSNVKSVVAVDINQNAVRALRERVQKEKIRQLRVLESDLFSKVRGTFDTIIFNPPYLPQDEGIVDVALYGGNKGWEVSERLFREAADFLTSSGKILFLFSSLTNKKRIDEIITSHLLEFRELERLKLAFEELYVYEIVKSGILVDLEKRGVSSVSYLAAGKRGRVYVGEMKSRGRIVKVAIKVKHEASKAQGSVDREAQWLEKVNLEGIGPVLVAQTVNYILYRYVEGTFFEQWVLGRNKKEICKVIGLILDQCFVLDQMGINKEEMHHPVKHILIAALGKPVLIDFERCYETSKPHNVTQFIDYITKRKGLFEGRGLRVDVDMLRKIGCEYKRERDESSLKQIKTLLAS